jgi:hypothetical protein
MQDLVREAISQGHHAADPVALAAQIHLFRSAALAGTSQTAARLGALRKKHHALARRLLGRHGQPRTPSQNRLTCANQQEGSPRKRSQPA